LLSLQLSRLATVLLSTAELFIDITTTHCTLKKTFN